MYYPGFSSSQITSGNSYILMEIICNSKGFIDEFKFRSGMWIYFCPVKGINKKLGKWNWEYIMSASGDCSHLEREPAVKSVLLQRTVVWTRAFCRVGKYISRLSIRYSEKGISVLKQCWHWSKMVMTIENSHPEVLDCHQRVTLVWQFLLPWIFHYCIRWNSKRRDREVTPDSLCTWAPNRRQWWAQSALVTVEAELRSLTPHDDLASAAVLWI